MKKRRVIFFAVIFVVLVFAAAATATVMISAQNAKRVLCVSPTGEDTIVLEYGQTYEEQGATAQFFENASAEGIDVPVKVKTRIPENAVGTYMIKYAAEYKGVVGTGYRCVKIVDTVAPEITLVADPQKYTLPNEQYEEEGFTATDNRDGDITDKVVRVETKQTVTYMVTDSSGNKAKQVREIVYNDPVPPELTLNGEDMVLYVGDDYQEPGYTATDNCDGDLTNKVTVSGGVNTFVEGRYTLTYKVEDSYKNSDSKTRVVFVKARVPDKVNDASKTDKVIYLTFDDGPGEHTDRLLDILKKYNVKATFFVVNTGYISTVKREAAEGHTVAIHSATHKFSSIYSSVDAYFADLYKMQDIIQSYTGKLPMLIRFPGGSSNTVSSSYNKGIMTRLAQSVEKLGFTYFDWNVDSNDAGGASTAQEVYNNVVAGIGSKKQSVVLMHDIKSYTVDAIEKIIVWGLDNGYTFLPLTESSPTCHHGINN